MSQVNLSILVNPYPSNYLLVVGYLQPKNIRVQKKIFFNIFFFFSKLSKTKQKKKKKIWKYPSPKKNFFSTFFFLLKIVQNEKKKKKKLKFFFCWNIFLGHRSEFFRHDPKFWYFSPLSKNLIAKWIGLIFFL